MKINANNQTKQEKTHPNASTGEKKGLKEKH